MKATERHQLKQNEFAIAAGRVADAVVSNRQRLILGLGAVVVLVLLVAAFVMWRGRAASEAGALLGVAMATAESPVVPASTLPGAVQQAGTFPTEEARSAAAIAAFNQVASQYPNSEAAAVASYQAAGELLAAGKASEAEAAFKAVAERAGNGFFGPLARLGEAQAMLAGGKAEEAAAILSELAARRDSVLPVDGILMELGRASLKAGKTAEARAAFKRVTDEFPDSVYASDVERRLAALN